jgi:hypothetical protein
MAIISIDSSGISQEINYSPINLSPSSMINYGWPCVAGMNQKVLSTQIRKFDACQNLVSENSKPTEPLFAYNEQEEFGTPRLEHTGVRILILLPYYYDG